MDKFKILRRIGWKLDDEGFPNQLDWNTFEKLGSNTRKE